MRNAYMSLVMSLAISLVTLMIERFTNRTSGVPRGLLRFLVLTMLAKKPMSGVETVQVRSIRFWLGCITEVSPMSYPAKKWE